MVTGTVSTVLALVAPMKIVLVLWSYQLNNC